MRWMRSAHGAIKFWPNTQVMISRQYWSRDRGKAGRFKRGRRSRKIMDIKCDLRQLQRKLGARTVNLHITTLREVYSAKTCHERSTGSVFIATLWTSMQLWNFAIIATRKEDSNLSLRLCIQIDKGMDKVALYNLSNSSKRTKTNGSARSASKWTQSRIGIKRIKLVAPHATR